MTAPSAHLPGPVKLVGAGLVFMAEMGMYVCLGLSGTELIDGVWGWVLGIAMVLVAIGIWATFLAPRAPRPPSVAGLIVLRLALVLFAAGLMIWLGGYWLGGATAVAMLIGTVLARGAERDPGWGQAMGGKP